MALQLLSTFEQHFFIYFLWFFFERMLRMEFRRWQKGIGMKEGEHIRGDRRIFWRLVQRFFYSQSEEDRNIKTPVEVMSSSSFIPFGVPKRLRCCGIWYSFQISLWLVFILLPGPQKKKNYKYLLLFICFFFFFKLFLYPVSQEAFELGINGCNVIRYCNIWFDFLVCKEGR